ncbi:MAG: ABC transporter ATP-binding protein [Phycisphaerales bacterium]|nr:ABC transporter ATP-binding protein [Phycisphaerales bacterium]
MSKTVTTERVVEAVGLTKVFRDFWMRSTARAVDGLSFHMDRGELFGLLGPNGSGKSTTIKLMLGLLNKTRGRLQVFGREPHDVAIKKHIGFLPEESYLYRYLDSRETLDYYGRLFGLDRSTRRRRTDELLDMVGLSQVAHRPVGEFSKGMMRRIGLAQALVNDPEFLILDEPTSGLDPIGTRQVKDLLAELRRRGKTILLSSHLLADVEDVCDRLVILYGGKIRAEGTADELLTDSDHTIIRIPRLRHESTVQRIEHVLEESEGAAIEAVERPRQKLESFFMRIVEEAQQEQAETSGAVHGGQTAAFLQRGEGDDLIERLVETKDTPLETEVIRPAENKPEVVDALVEANDEESAPRVREAETALETPKDVDSSMIDSLLQGEGEESEGEQTDS